MGNKIVKIIFAILVLGALLVIVGAWMVWKRPLTIDAWMSRTALKINGLEKNEARHRTPVDDRLGRRIGTDPGAPPRRR